MYHLVLFSLGMAIYPPYQVALRTVMAPIVHQTCEDVLLLVQEIGQTVMDL